MKYNLEVRNLEKSYPDFKLDKVNILVPKGKIVGFIGVNGSGKTTTIKAILNLINYDKGNIKILGKDNTKLTKDLKEQIGVVLDDSFLAPIINVKDVDKLMKDFYRNWDSKLYYEYIKDFKIPTNRPVKEFSSGMKMKLKVICAIAHRPKLLILDEPTNGLDPIFRYEIADLFAKFVQNKENSILMTTHITSDLEHIADEVIFIDNGRVILDIPKKVIDEDYGLCEIDKNKISQFTPQEYTRLLKYKNEYLLLTNDKASFSKKYPKIAVRRPTLEEVMLLLIKGEEV